MREKTKLQTTKVDYWAKYTGPETLDITPGKIYHVIGVIHNEGMEGYLGVIDDTEESYIYAPDNFHKIDNIDLPFSEGDTA